jgi:D-inositol-3-phosphate glycosyltransferase
VRRADRIVAECPQDRDDLIRLYRADASKIDIVPCGYDPAELRALPRGAARQRLGWNQHEFTLLQLGRLVPRKGVDNVIRSLAPLRDRYGIDARLYIAGGDSEEADESNTPEIGRLASIAREHRVIDNVCFLGRRNRDALSQLYSAADVFVSTPDYEPFGITPVEAMACAAAVVGSRVGGIRSTVVDGVTGLLVPPRDPHALAAALARLHGDPQFREACGRAGSIRARSDYTWQRVAGEIGRVYRRAARPLPQTGWAPVASGIAVSV